MSVAPINLLDLFGSSNSSNVKFHIESKAILNSATITACIPGNPYHTQHPGFPGLPHYPGHGGNDYTTVYTTEYVQVCPTEVPCPKGTRTKTYVITETCTGDKNGYTRPAIPPHFTTTLKVCDTCEGKPTLTITHPMSEETGSSGGQEGTKGKGGDSKGTDDKIEYSKGSDGKTESSKGTDSTDGKTNSDAPMANKNGDFKDQAQKSPGATGSNGTYNSNGYIQANIASSGRAEAALLLVSGAIGIAAWVL